MISVTFKNVGQGDSIILEWDDTNNTTKVAIIDCALAPNGSNPVLQHVKSNGIGKIDFMLMSHPHLDHYSGFLQLLQYCKHKGIQVDKFFHTARSIPQYLKIVAQKLNKQKVEFRQLWRFLLNEREKMGMQVGYLDATELATKRLNSYGTLSVLAPMTREIQRFEQHLEYFENGEAEEKDVDLNLLSTVIQIKTHSGYLLLTSDATPFTLRGITPGLSQYEQEQGNSDSALLWLAQVPHHGASGNHWPAFWQARKRHPKPNAMFSVGNNDYGHPSGRVVYFFKNEGFQIWSTNPIGALQNLMQNQSSKRLNGLSSNVSKELYGNKKFVIEP